MAFSDREETVFGPGTCCKPGRELVLPEEGVAAVELAGVFAGVVDLVTESVVGNVTLWLR